MTTNGEQRRVYEAWVADYADDLYRLAYRLTGRRSVAEELVQETFYHAWRSMHTLRETSKARAWLFQIVRHRYSHWVRDQSRRLSPGTLHDAHEDLAAAVDYRPLEVMADEEAIRLALETLDDRFKLPLLMVYVEGLTCQQAAEQLELPLGTVLSRLHRARRMMRQQLDTEGGEKDTDGENEKDSGDQPRLKLGG